MSRGLSLDARKNGINYSADRRRLFDWLDEKGAEAALTSKIYATGQTAVKYAPTMQDGLNHLA